MPSVRRVAAALALAACAAVLGLAWAFASPPTSTPDEDYHLASIWCPPPVSASGCTVGTFEGKPAVLVPTLMAGRPCYTGLLDESASCQFVDPDRLVWSTRFDAGDYPGPYFRVLHALVGPDTLRSVVTMRAVNVGIAVVLVGAAIALTPAASRSGASRALLGGVVPLGLFVTASVNPSSWAFTGLTACWLGLHAAAVRGPGWPKIAAAAVAVAGAVLASCARGDTAPFVVIIVVALAALHLRARRPDWVWLAAAGSSVLAGAVSFLRSRQSSGVAQTSVGNDDLGYVIGHDLTELFQVPFGVIGLPPWGALGWLDLAMPSTVVVPLLTLAGFAIFSGLRRVDFRKAIALVVVGGALLALPFYMLVRNLDLAGIQPRYFMSLVPLFFALCWWRPGAAGTLAITRGQAVLAWVGLSVAQCVALLTVLRRYTTGLQGPYWPGLDATWWWPFGPAPWLWWMLGTGAFGVLAWAFVRGRHAEPDADLSDSAR